MYKVSDNYLAQTKKKTQSFRIKGKINTIDFTEHDIMSGSLEITNQCSELNDVKIGSVYIGELKCTFKPWIITDWDNAEIKIYEGLYIEDTQSYEDIPLGIYYISSAEDTDNGTDIVAYDAMVKFNKTRDLDITFGTPYELALLACNKCEVELGMNESELQQLANGMETLSLYTENDIKTWQDYIYWLAQSLGAFATIDRYGRLVFRQYTNKYIDKLTNHNRFSGSKFSKFKTRYSGLSCVNIADDTTSYYGLKEDNYLTYNLGANPFLQYGLPEYKEQIRRNILNAIAQIDYVPFETGVLCGALYDLGDVICCTDGIAPGQNGCIMFYDYIYNGGYKIAGYGSNPALASAKSKSDKNLEGLRSNVSSKEMLFFKYENAAAVTINDTETKNIIDIRFTSAQASNIIFQAEILLEADATVEDVIGSITYSLNEVEIQTYHPMETWKNGKHILSLMYLVVVEENQINRWIVKLNSAGGTISIQQGGIHAVVYGQGLVGTSEWDGFITLEEQALEVALSKSISVDDNIAESVLAVMLDVDRTVLSDVLTDVILHSGTTPEQIAENVMLSWNIEYWTFDTSSTSTYAERYVDVLDGVYKLASSFVNKSSNITIDLGLLNMVAVDNTEFVGISAIELSDDTAVVKYLLHATDKWYTIADGVLTEITLAGETLTHDDFLTFGAGTVPTSDILITLTSPEIYKWTQEAIISDTTATITAVPHPQSVQTRCDMSDVSIIGITDAAAVYEGNIGVRLSYNGGLVFTDEETLSDAISGSLLQAYDKLDENKVLDIAFILNDAGDTLTQFKYTFKN